MGCGKARFGFGCGLPQTLMCRSLRDPRERTLRPKFSILGGFLPLLTETSFTTSPYYAKYEVWAIINFFGTIPLTPDYHHFKFRLYLYLYLYTDCTWE